ncbi:MAG: hypothetical protein SGI74_07385 [Oligoflexia bacterium]|nr:hypothetical protein [Oligoflexia bacterium]
MILFIVIVMMVALGVIYCVRHFFVQLIALKLFIDSLVFVLMSLKKPEQYNFNSQAAAWFIAAFGCMMIFVLMAAGTKRFSHSENLDLESDSE